jgi:autotransporter-associated beta strand protein
MFRHLWTKVCGRKSGRTGGTRPGGTRRPAGSRLRLEQLETRIVPAIDTWTGASITSSQWGDAANWSGGAVPHVGDTLFFPATAQRKANTNNFAADTRFASIVINGSGYNLSGNEILLEDRTLIGFFLQPSPGKITQTASGTNTITFNVVINQANTTVDVATGGDLILNGAISGTGGLTKTNPGTLELGGSADNTLSGTTTVNGGTLALNKNDKLAISGPLVVGDGTGTDKVLWEQIGQLAFPIPITVNSSGLLDLTSAGGVDFGKITMTGGKIHTGTSSVFLTDTVTMTSASATNPAFLDGNLFLFNTEITFTVNPGPDTTADAFVSGLSGVSNTTVTKDGAGTLSFGANTYDGPTDVKAGILIAGSLGSTVSGTTIEDGASLEVNGSSLAAENITLKGQGVGGNGTLLSTGYENVLGANLTLATNVIVNTVNNAPGEPSLLPSLSLNGKVTGPGGITKIGQGTLVLGHANDYQGATNVNTGGLEVTDPSSLGNAAAITTVANGAVLFANVAGTVPQPLVLNGTGVVGGGVLTGFGTFSGPISLASDTTIGGSVNLSGQISGPHALTLVPDQLTFSGSSPNIYTGPTTVNGVNASDNSSATGLTLAKSPGVNAVPGALIINGGFVSVQNPEQIPDTAPITINGAFLSGPASETIGPLTLNGGDVTPAAGAPFTLNGDVTLVPGFTSFIENISLGSQTRTFTVPASTELLVQGAIFAPSGIGLIKDGPGVMRMPDGGSYTGPTTVKAGTLEVGNLPQSSVTVNPGALLAGAGAVKSLTVNGASLSPGAVEGGFGTNLSLFTSNGNVAFTGSSHYLVDLHRPPAQGGVPGKDFDQLQVTGTVTLGNASLDVGDLFTFVSGVTYPIIHSTGGIIGTFAQGSQFTRTNPGTGVPELFTINYHGGPTGTDVVVTDQGPAPPGPTAAFQNRSVTSQITEGSVATLRGTIVDSDPHGTFLLQVTWGDGSAPKTFTFPPSAPRTVSLNHRYADEGQFTVHLVWQDRNGPSNSADLAVTVVEAPPVVQTGGDVTLGTGGILNRLGSFTDPGADTWTATVDYGDGSGVQTLDLHGTNFLLHHTYATAGTFRVTVSVQDEGGAVGTASFLVTVPDTRVPGPGGSILPPGWRAALDAWFRLLGETAAALETELAQILRLLEGGPTLTGF